MSKNKSSSLTVILISIFILFSFAGTALADTDCANGTYPFKAYPAGGGCGGSGFNDGTNMYFIKKGKTEPIVTVLGKKTTSPQGGRTICLAPGDYILKVADSFHNQRLGCYITVNATGWSYLSPCSADPLSCSETNATVQKMCKGCSIPGISGKQGTNTFYPGCIPYDNSDRSYWRAYLLDRRNNNLLFRGPEPVVFNCTADNAQFDWTNLIATLKDRYTTQTGKKDFPTSFNFYDISLISDTGGTKPISNSQLPEELMLMTESQFFTKSASLPAPRTIPSKPVPITGTNIKGSLVWWQIKPNSESDMGGLISFISQKMAENSKSTTPNVLYFHCASGTDRTGAVAVSYLFSNRTLPLKDAYKYGTTTFAASGAKPGKLARQIPQPQFLDSATQYCISEKKAGKVTGNCTFINNSAIPSKDCPYVWSKNCSWNKGKQK